MTSLTSLTTMISQTLPILGSSLTLLLLCVVLLWLWSIKINNASIIDIFWGIACATPAWVAYIFADGYPPRKLLLVSLATLWAVRLSGYLAIRNIGHGEDPRYTAMRSRAPAGSNPNLFTLKKVFLLQGVIAWLIAMPIQLGQIGGPAQLGWLAILGTMVFFIGLAFETIGDYQLKRFKADPANKGKLMTRGLWSWTRHPNYFGDSAVWFGLTLVAIENPLALFGIYSPALMLFFLTQVTGKSLLEKGMRERYTEYDDYVKRVSGFFPRPPKNV